MKPNAFPRSGENFSRPAWLTLLSNATLSALLLIAPAARAQEEKLPKAAAILDKYVEVTGGKEAYKKIKNRVIKGTLEIPAQNLKASLVIYSARPNLMYTVLEIPGMMKEESGTDGKVAWNRNSMTGPRILEGDEFSQTMRQADFDSTVEWRRLYKNAKTLGVEDVKGSPAYTLELTYDNGDKVTAYFDQKSSLQVRMDMVAETQMGEIPIESYLSDYKDAGGVLVPCKTTSTVMMQERTLTFDSIEVNVDLPKDRFELPDDIKELIKQPEATSKPKEAPTP
jgi:outer membrane lipoprotein-sorting protein